MRLALYTTDNVKVLTAEETVRLTTEEVSAYIADGYKLKKEER
jgi:F420-dependent methylenetetrahydromethanopterin dehydrogenase